MCADETASLLIGTHTSFAMLSPSSQPLSGLVKQWVGDRLRRGPEALLQAAARRGPEAVLRDPAATTRDLPPQVPHGTEEQSTPMHPAARRCHGCVRRCYPIAYPTAHAPRATTSTGEGACDLTYLFTTTVTTHGSSGGTPLGPYSGQAKLLALPTLVHHRGHGLSQVPPNNRVPDRHRDEI